MAENLRRKDYEEELERLHVELVKLQEWTTCREAPRDRPQK